jgi:hypothetical protein
MMRNINAEHQILYFLLLSDKYLHVCEMEAYYLLKGA